MACGSGSSQRGGRFFHRYHARPGHLGERVFDSYVDRGTGAWRLFWTWGPAETDDQDCGDRGVVTVLVIGPHP
ncbi:hypothetical protein [Kitasatospora sp. McL0602]|uniref:hypothetical protein n=1 Tax=Kitasatospora sp. McL0602 TaxID=3439530 RepID=UPI003F8C791E